MAGDRRAAAGSDGAYTSAIRPHFVTPRPDRRRSRRRRAVLVTELSGSESVVHFDLGGILGVAVHGIHPFEVGEEHAFHIDIGRQCLYFDADERLVEEG